MAELGYWDRKRIHNLKYYTWIEQQQKEIIELNQQWDDYRSYWPERLQLSDQYDQLIVKFNQLVSI